MNRNSSQVRAALIFIAAAGACGNPAGDNAGKPAALPLEVDHVYLWVTPGAQDEIEALRRIGLVVDEDPTHHAGQGTSAVSVEFRNAYLELIYLDPAIGITAALQEEVQDFRRRAAWRETGASPVGIGFHRQSGAPIDLPIPSRPYRPDWLRNGTTIERLGIGENAVAPRMFVLPDYLAVEDSAALLVRLETDTVLRTLLRHRIGTTNLTGIRVVLSDSSGLTDAVQQVDSNGLVDFEVGEAPLLELEFDHGHKGKEADLRPILPLIMTY